MPYDVMNLVIVTKTNMLNEMPCGCGTLITTAVRIWHHVSCRAQAEVSAALEVSHRPAQRSHLPSKSPTDLRRGLIFSRCLPQTCAEVSALPKFDYPNSHIS